MIVTRVVHIVDRGLSDDWYSYSISCRGYSGGFSWFRRARSYTISIPWLLVVAAPYWMREVLIGIVLRDGATVYKLLLLFVDPCFAPYQFHPVSGILFIFGLKMEVLGR